MKRLARLKCQCYNSERNLQLNNGYNVLLIRSGMSLQSICKVRHHIQGESIILLMGWGFILQVRCSLMPFLHVCPKFERRMPQSCGYRDAQIRLFCSQDSLRLEGV